MDENKEKELASEEVVEETAEKAEKLTSEEKEEVEEILEKFKNTDEEAQIVTDWDGLAQVGDTDAVFEEDEAETDEEESDETEEEEIPEENLCERCGKRERFTELDEDYPYCKVCRESMKKTRMNAWGVITFILTFISSILCIVFGVFAVVTAVPVFKGDRYMAENKFVSAITSYEEALSSIESLNSQAGGTLFDAGNKTYQKLIKAYAGMGSVTYARDYFSALENAGVLEQLKYKAANEYNESYNKMMDTYGELQTAYSNALNEFFGKKEKADVSEAEKYLTELEELKKKEKYDPYMVAYFQYLFCSVTDNSLYESIKYLEEIKSGGRTYEFIYAIELCMNYLEKGDYEKAEKTCYESLEASPENIGVYQYLMISKRRQGDFEGALKLGEEARKLAETMYTGQEGYSALHYAVPMEEAIVYALQGEKEKAIEAIDESFEQGNDNSNLNISILLHYLFHVKGTEPVEEEGEKIYDNVDEMYDQGVATIAAYGSYYGLSISDNVQAIMDGKKTLEDVFMNGEVDWQ